MRTYSVTETEHDVYLTGSDEEYVYTFARLPKEQKSLLDGFCKLLNQEVQGAYNEGIFMASGSK